MPLHSQDPAILVFDGFNDPVKCLCRGEHPNAEILDRLMVTGADHHVSRTQSRGEQRVRLYHYLMLAHARSFRMHLMDGIGT